MFDNPGAVAAVYAVFGGLFLLALFAGAAIVLARVVYYQIHKAARPRLLTRDVIVFGGMALSFGLIAVIRFLPAEPRLELTAGNVLWALLTSLPAAISACVFVYYEVFVVKRGVE